MESVPRVIMTTYKPVSENLPAPKPETGGEAEGNCVVARRCGKQPEAKEQSQTQVNSIQLMYAASLRGNGEACAKRNLDRCHLPEIGESRGCMGGWSENAPKEGCVSGESWRMDRQCRSSTTAGILFLTNLNEPFTPNRLTQFVRDYVNASEIGKKGSCHLFRHTCATLMHENGADIRCIQQLLGTPISRRRRFIRK